MRISWPRSASHRSHGSRENPKSCAVSTLRPTREAVALIGYHEYVLDQVESRGRLAQPEGSATLWTSLDAVYGDKFRVGADTENNRLLLKCNDMEFETVMSLLTQLAALVFSVATLLFFMVRLTGDPALVMAGEYADPATLEALREKRTPVFTGR